MNTSAHDNKISILERALIPDGVCFLKATAKDTVLRDMIDVLATSSHIRDKDALTDAVFKREAIMSTGIGLGLAVPHVRIASVGELVMAIGVSHEGIGDYVSLDDKPVHVVFLIAAPEGQHVEYLQLLSAISSRAKTLAGCLLDCPDANALYELLVRTGRGSGTAETAGGYRAFCDAWAGCDSGGNGAGRNAGQSGAESQP